MQAVVDLYQVFRAMLNFARAARRHLLSWGRPMPARRASWKPRNVSPKPPRVPTVSVYPTYAQSFPQDARAKESGKE